MTQQSLHKNRVPRTHATPPERAHDGPLLGLDPAIVARIEEIGLEKEAREKHDRKHAWRGRSERYTETGKPRALTLEESVAEWRPEILREDE